MSFSITNELRNARDIIQRQFFRITDLEHQATDKDKEIQRLKTMISVNVVGDQQRRIVVLQKKLEVSRDIHFRLNAYAVKVRNAHDARGAEIADLKQKLEARNQENDLLRNVIAELNSRPKFEGTALRQQEIIAELQIKIQGLLRRIDVETESNFRLIEARNIALNERDTIRGTLQRMIESRDKWRSRALYRARTEPNRLALMLDEDKTRKEQQLRQQYSPLPVTMEDWARNCDTQKASEGHKSPLC